MDDELSEKQAFLRENILDKGYDAEEFMKLLQTKKGEIGLDLGTWSMEELQEAVNEFTKENEDTEETEKKEENKTETEDDNMVYDLDQFSKDHPEGSRIIKEEYGKCAITEFTEFSNKENIFIKISNPEKVNGGIFSKSFISYTVETHPFNFQTKKRYSDFLWLRNTLLLMYPNCVIPPLCKKNYIERFSEDLINKRMRSLEKFINGLLIHPLIKNSQILFDFLSIQNEADFYKKKKKYGKITSPTHIGEIKTLEGDIKISVSKEKEMYLKNIQDNSYLNAEFLQKITKAYKALMNLKKEIVIKMKEISCLWNQVYEKSVKYMDIHNTSRTYDILSKFMSSWAETEKQQSEIANIYVREYFRFIKNEYNSMYRMGEKVDNSKTIYKKALEKLETTKENLFKQQDLSQWEINETDMDNKTKTALLGNKEMAFAKMLPKETKRVNMFKAFYGGYLNSIINEYERLRLLNAKRHKENINNFIKQLSDCITSFHVSLADRLMEFGEMKDVENAQTTQLDKNDIIEEQEQDQNKNNNK